MNAVATKLKENKELFIIELSNDGLNHRYTSLMTSKPLKLPVIASPII